MKSCKAYFMNSLKNAMYPIENIIDTPFHKFLQVCKTYDDNNDNNYQ